MVDDLRYLSWIDDVAGYFDAFARSSFFHNNPVLDLCRISGYSPTEVVLNQDDEESPQAAYCLNQMLCFLAADGLTYRQIVHDRPVGHDPATFWTVMVPFWTSLADVRHELSMVRRLELSLLTARKSSGARLPDCRYANHYLSLDYIREPDSSIDPSVISKLSDGCQVASLAEVFERVAVSQKILTPNWAADPKTFAHIMALNTVVNRYWIAHMLCGAHAQYRSSEELDRAARASLFGLPRPLLVNGVAIRPTLYRVLVSPLEGIKKSLCFVNSAVLNLYSKGSGRQRRSGVSYFWKVQQVAPDGRATMMNGKIMEISSAQLKRLPVLENVRRLIENLEARLPFVAEDRNGAEELPLIAVVPAGCAAPTADYNICNVGAYDGNTSEVPVSSHVVDAFQFE